EDRLDQVGTKSERRSNAGNGQHGRGQCRILHASTCSETQTRKHCSAGCNEIRVTGEEVRLCQQHIRSADQELGRQTRADSRLAQWLQRLAGYLETLRHLAEEDGQRRACLGLGLLQIRYRNLCCIERGLLCCQVNWARYGSIEACLDYIEQL